MILAIVSARHALNAEKDASHQLYISDMNLIQREWEAGNAAHVQELLKETASNEEKGFEWDYWNRISHQSLRTFSLTGKMCSVAFSPNQQQVAGLSEEGMLKIWDVVSGDLGCADRSPALHSEGA